MSIKITSISEALENNGLKFLVHGMAGSGKTVLCATTGAPTLIISAESGLLSIAEAPDYIKTTVVKTIDELEQAYDYLEQNLDQFDWVCIDSISEIAETLLADEKKLSKDPRQAYGNLMDRMGGILKSFRDLPNMNVLMSCKQQLLVSDDIGGVSRYVPMLAGKALTNSIPYLFDEVFCLRVEKDDEGDDYRTLQTGRDRNYEAKDRSGKLEMFEPANMRKIAAKIREGQPEKIEEKDQEIENDQSPQELTQDQIDQSEIVSQQEQGKIEPLDELLNDTDKPIYLYHSKSDSVLKLSPDDSIDDDGHIKKITYKAFMEHKKRLKG